MWCTLTLPAPHLLLSRQRILEYLATLPHHLIPTPPRPLPQALHASDVCFTMAVTKTTNSDAELVYMSRGFERMTGYSTTFALGRNCRFLQESTTCSWAALVHIEYLSD